jgi:DNA-binding transcriptional LysR family regulator
MGGTLEVLAKGQADIAVSNTIPPGFAGESLLRMRFLAVAHPDHPLHQLGRAVTLNDLRAHRQLLVRETSSTRSTRPSMETAQRWTVTDMSTSIQAARMGYGFAWLPEEKIREELASNTLKPLPLREGRERYAELYLVYAHRDSAGPGVLRLGEIIQETTKQMCAEQTAKTEAKAGRERRR